MERLFEYFDRYQIHDNGLQHFLYIHGRIREYRSKNQYHNPDPFWCFIIQGAVALEYNAKGKVVIDRVYIRHDYFSNTEHIYTKRMEKGLYVFLQDSIIYEISNEKLQQALSNYPLMERMFNILKQQQLNLINHLKRVLKIPCKMRIDYMDKHLPELLHILTVEQRCSLLNISNLREYYKALRYWRQK